MYLIAHDYFLTFNIYKLFKKFPCSKTYFYCTNTISEEPKGKVTAKRHLAFILKAQQ